MVIQSTSLLEDMTPAERAAFKGITIDSYEKGAQNWTDGFAAEFESDIILPLDVSSDQEIDAVFAELANTE